MGFATSSNDNELAYERGEQSGCVVLSPPKTGRFTEGAQERLNQLCRLVIASHNTANIELISKAYWFAEEAHYGAKRLTGEPFITHPWNVALIVAELGMDEETIAAALLHDCVEDSGVSIEEIRQRFGVGIANLVDGVTKLKHLSFLPPREQQAENMRKMLLAMARDVRVVIIKLADRLHNLKTIDPLPSEKKLETAKETLQVFAPLAHRLGIWRLKWQLEDLAFRHIDPKAYSEISAKVQKTRAQRESFVESACRLLKQRLEEEGIKAEVQGRAKHLYSIYMKMQREGVDFEHIYDLYGLRVIVNTVSECYAALGVVHSLWRPIPGMVSDYISHPKANRYRSLHTKVIGPDGQPLEVQIRTWEMHIEAEYGIAAHWKYKEGRERDTELDKALRWIREQMLSLHSESHSPKEFLESVVADIFKDQVFVFTPKGDVIELPVGSTPVDFAYRIHTDIGHRCVGARVNGKLVPLDYQLNNGDIVEIITSKHSKGPSPHWLRFVRTSHAKNRIKRFLKMQAFEENVQRGRELLVQAAKRKGLTSEGMLSEEQLQSVAKAFQCESADQLLAAIGYGDISPEAVLLRLAPTQPQHKEVRAKRKHPPQGRMKLMITLKGGTEIEAPMRLSKCCRPIPGDAICGYITRGKGITVHRVDCSNLSYLRSSEPERVVELEWQLTAEGVFQTELLVEAIDRVGLLSDLAGIISELGINIASCNVETIPKFQLARVRFVIDVTGPEALHKVVEALRRHPDVTSIVRVTR